MLKTSLLTTLLVGLISSPAEQGQALLPSPLAQAQLPEKTLEQALEKITFDLSTISSEGLTGPEAGKRAVSYEFCIPATATHLAEVQAIDPSVQHFPGSRGRIGCTRNQYLCIGNTHQSGWRAILLEIAGLDYVGRIDQFWGE